jgi:hypothetical protein
MTTEKEISIIFKADLLAQSRLGNITFRLFSNALFYVHVPQFEKIGIEVINFGSAFLDENGGGEYYNVYHFDSFSDVDPETREWAADTSGNKYTISDAIVIGSLSQKIITDFYLRINKPAKPTRIFYSLEKAIAWTLELKEKS